MANPIIPKTNSAPGAGAPLNLLLGEIATNRSSGELYLGTDAGVEIIGQRVTSISRGGTGSSTAAAALTALGAAPLVSPSFSGIPTVPTASAGTNTTQAASTAFVQANKGDSYRTTSNTIWNIQPGITTFVVSPGLSYTPTQDVTIAYDANNHAHGTVVSYSGVNLVVDVHQKTGSGTYSSWLINIGGMSDPAGVLLSVNNLSDVASPSAALANIGGVSSTAVISVLRGGTGSTSAQSALNVLAGTVTAGQFLGGDGTNIILRAIASSDLPASGVLAGQYGSSAAIPVITLDSKGRVSAIATQQIQAGISLTTLPAAALSTEAISGISPEAARADHTHAIPTTALSGDVLGTGQGSVLTALTTTGVSAGAYGGSAAIPVLTVDAKGRVTAASTVALPAGLGLTTQPAAALQTAALAGISAEAARADHVHQTPTTTLTGDATGSGAGSVAVTLETTGVAANTYGSTAAIPVLTIDAKGRITLASTASALRLGTTSPAALGTSAAVGISTLAARLDHVHQIPFPAINSTASTAYTLTLADNNDTVQFTAATAVAVTIPTNATAAFPIGSQILLLQYGAGQLTVGGAGVTIRSSGGKLKSAVQYSLMTLLKIGTDEWVLGGDITT